MVGYGNSVNMSDGAKRVELLKFGGIFVNGN